MTSEQKKLFEKFIHTKIKKILNESPETNIIKSFEKWVTDLSNQTDHHPKPIKSIIKSYLSKQNDI